MREAVHSNGGGEKAIVVSDDDKAFTAPLLSGQRSDAPPGIFLTAQTRVRTSSLTRAHLGANDPDTNLHV